MAESFDAVLAEMRALAQRRREEDGDITSYEVEDFADRLQSAHAAAVAELEQRAEFFAVVSDCEFVGIPDLRRTARGLESAQCTIATIDGKPTVRLSGLRIDGHGAAIAGKEGVK